MVKEVGEIGVRSSLSTFTSTGINPVGGQDDAAVKLGCSSAVGVPQSLGAPPGQPKGLDCPYCGAQYKMKL